jgi:hypothetical protein
MAYQQEGLSKSKQERRNGEGPIQFRPAAQAGVIRGALQFPGAGLLHHGRHRIPGGAVYVGNAQVGGYPAQPAFIDD